jgi:predicted ribosome quality control (RQC) complex YloA/Tae2 family protein
MSESEHAEHQWIVDSIEEGMASVEVDGDRTITVPLSTLPAGTREGHVLRVRREQSGDGQRSTLAIELDAAATKRALAESARQARKHEKQRNDPGGDIVL